MCPRGWTVYWKNKNNFVECFKIGGKILEPIYLQKGPKY